VNKHMGGRDEYRTQYKALYKCAVYFTYYKYYLPSTECGIT